MTSRLDSRFRNSRLSRQSQQQLLSPSGLSERDKNLLLNPALTKELRKTKKKLKGRKRKGKAKAKQPKRQLELTGNLGVVISLAQRKTFEDRQEAAEKKRLLQEKLRLMAEDLRIKDVTSQREFVARAGESRVRDTQETNRLALERQRHNDGIAVENRRIDADIARVDRELASEERRQQVAYGEAQRVREDDRQNREREYLRAREAQEADIRDRDARVAQDLERARIESEEKRQEGQLAHEREVRAIDLQREQNAQQSALDLEKQKALQSELDFLHRDRAATEELRVREVPRDLTEADKQFLQRHTEQINARVDTGLQGMRSELREHIQRTEANLQRRDQLSQQLPTQLSSDIRSILRPLEERVDRVEQLSPALPTQTEEELNLSPAQTVRSAASNTARRTPRSPEARQLEQTIHRLSQAEQQLFEMTGVPTFTGTPTSPVSSLRTDVESPTDTQRTLVEPEPESEATPRPVLRRAAPKPGEQFGGGLVGQAGEVIVGLGQEIRTETEAPEGILVGRSAREQERETLSRQREQSFRDYNQSKGRLTELANTGAGRRSQAQTDELRRFRITNVTENSIGNIGAGESVRVVGTRTSTERSPGGSFALSGLVHSNERGSGRNNTSTGILDRQIEAGNLIFQQVDP